MTTREPQAAELELFEHARELLARTHHPEIHQVAAALRTSTGQIYYGLHLGSRRINVCAESSALANATMAGDIDVIAMVAVCKDDDDRIVVTNPCGVCRELMGTYCREAEVMVDIGGTVGVIDSRELMPLPWMFPRENDWSVESPRTENLRTKDTE